MCGLGANSAHRLLTSVACTARNSASSEISLDINRAVRGQNDAGGSPEAAEADMAKVSAKFMAGCGVMKVTM